MKYPTRRITATSGAPTPNRPESDPRRLSEVVEEEVVCRRCRRCGNGRNMEGDG